MAAGTIRKENIDSGSGYLKLPDGTLICWITKTFNNQNLTSAWGSMYTTASALDLGSWPESFTGTPVVAVSTRDPADTFLGRINVVSPVTEKVGVVYPYAPTSLSNKTITVNVIGIGRWKS